ncbi:MAG: hypothetical protein AB9891_06210 [Anaerolineaceae bacterium]
MKNTNQLSRRDFLKLGASAAIITGLSACGLDVEPTSDPTPKNISVPSPIPIPSSPPTSTCADLGSLAPIPPTRGISYIAAVPDTLDLQQRAEMVIAAMTNCTDPKNNFAPFDNMNIWRNPPFLRSTTMFNGKYIEATGLLRNMTGSTQNQHVDQSWRNLFLQSQSDYPWWGIDGGRILAWLGNNLSMERNPCWQELGKQVIGRLAQKMVYKDDYCYYPNDLGEMPKGWETTHSGWGLQGLTQLYLATRNPEALDLARKTARFLKDYSGVFDKNARFLARHESENGPALHFHHNGNALEGIAAYALAANDIKFASFARAGYEWVRSFGSPLVGFFPEYIEDWPDDRPYIDCETCCTADMIQIAMNLTAAGQGDYWDDVDRYLRNQFVEMQLLDSGWIDRMVAALPPTTPYAGEDSDRVSGRIIGSFSSWATANDWYIEGQPGTTFCCIGNAGRTLYYVWEKMISFRNGTLRLHLLLNRASSWVDVNSHVPYEGRVDLEMKTACNLEFRIPEWVNPDEVSALVNGKERDLIFQGRYAIIGYVEAGDKATVSFPIFERTVDVVIGNVPYKLVIKGNDVVSIDPPGKWCPFYQREKYLQNQVQWVERERFIPEF